MFVCMIKFILFLLALTPYSFAGEILQDGIHTVSSTVVKFLWAMLIPIACSGGAAFLIIGLRNFCDYIERRRMEKLGFEFAEQEEMDRQAALAAGGQAFSISEFMADGKQPAIASEIPGEPEPGHAA